MISGILSLLGFGEVRVNGQTNETKIVSFEVQLETFKRLGFKINGDIVLSQVWKKEDIVQFEHTPYSIMYMELGRTVQKEPWTPLTNQCWDFDTEAIEDNGAYIEIMKNLERITRGEIKFENLKDYVDVEGEKAWVSFEIKGVEYKWNLKVDDDWADPNLFTKVVGLTNKLKTRGKFTYFDTGGQNAVIGYETPDKRAEIIKTTGLKIEWLN